jgi:hypothetical protein
MYDKGFAEELRDGDYSHVWINTEDGWFDMSTKKPAGSYVNFMTLETVFVSRHEIGPDEWQYKLMASMPALPSMAREIPCSEIKIWLQLMGSETARLYQEYIGPVSLEYSPLKWLHATNDIGILDNVVGLYYQNQQE